MTPTSANFLLLLAGAIWGMGFIAQQTAMDKIGPFLFIACRFALASLSLLPFVWRELRKRTDPQQSGSQLTLGAIASFTALGVVFFVGMGLQQIGLLGTSVTNAGFLTTLYVIFVPPLVWIFFREQPRWFVWPATVVCVLGVYLLSFGHFSRIAWGDWYILACAVVWAFHVILVGRFAKRYEIPITMTCVQFAVCSVIACAGHGLWALALGQSYLPDFRLLQAAAVEIFYTGVISGGVAFTLQAIGQRYTSPSIAAILMASECLFAALFGALLLGERLQAVGYFGCALIFAAIVFVECAQHWFPIQSSKEPVPDSL